MGYHRLPVSQVQKPETKTCRSFSAVRTYHTPYALSKWLDLTCIFRAFEPKQQQQRMEGYTKQAIRMCLGAISGTFSERFGISKLNLRCCTSLEPESSCTFCETAGFASGHTTICSPCVPFHPLLQKTAFAYLSQLCQSSVDCVLQGVRTGGDDVTVSVGNRRR